MDIPFVYDRYVTNKDFAGRKSECLALTNLLAAGEHIVLSEPPKSGKKSLIQQAFFVMRLGGKIINAAVLDMFNLRSTEELLTRFGSTVIRSVSSSPDEYEDIVSRHLAGTHFVFDRERFAVSDEIVSLNWSPDMADMEAIFSLPFKIAEESGAGYVFRTSCEEADARAIEKECLELKKKYDSIKNEHKNTNKVKCILKDDALTVAKRFAYRDENFSENFGEIEKQTEEIGQRKIIKEGVELVFDKTEAMTAVDINLHKFVKSYGNTEETNYQANLIAVKELARQIRLRNTGGIIMVDFISLKDKEKTESLKKALSEELKKDHEKTSVELIESIGMFAIVRRKRYSEVY